MRLILELLNSFFKEKKDNIGIIEDIVSSSNTEFTVAINTIKKKLIFSL
jgi:hypothetical protein